jgi:hypothetical protein
VPRLSLKERVAETYTRTLMLQVEATHSRAKVAGRAIGVLDSHRPSVVAEFGEALYHNLSRLDISYPSRQCEVSRIATRGLYTAIIGQLGTRTRGIYLNIGRIF